jgi:hypothetical protein
VKQRSDVSSMKGVWSGTPILASMTLPLIVTRVVVNGVELTGVGAASDTGARPPRPTTP